MVDLSPGRREPATPTPRPGARRPVLSDMEVRAAALVAASSYRLSGISEAADRRAVLDRAELFAQWIRTGRTSGEQAEETER